MARSLALLALVGVSVFSVTPSSTAATAADSAHSPGQTAGLLWGGKRFLTRRAFDRWLRPRSLSFPTWAAKHAAGRRILAGGLRKRHSARPSPSSPTTAPSPSLPSATITATAPRAGASPPAAHGGRSQLALTLAAAALVLGAFALVPLQRLAPNSRFTAAVLKRRAALSGVALAILIGILVAGLSH
jgi:hypothetical protein